MQNQLGRYQLRRPVGRGAAGTVWDAWDTVLARRVAIKAVRAHDHDAAELEELMARFRLEAQVGGQFSHPGVVQVYDYGEIDGEAFIVMEFIDGETLKTALDRKKPLPLDRAAEIIRGVLQALEPCHQQNIVHRDIKPGNIMLPASGGVKLADFGIAHADTSELTIMGAVMGTPAYMSPEQFTARHPVDYHSDIWSAGVVLYEMLTGTRPFAGTTMATIGQAVVNDGFEPPSRRMPGLPAALDQVVARALRKSPKERYPSAQGFWLAVQEAIPASLVSRPDAAPRRGLAERTPIWSAPRGGIVLVGILGLTFAAAGGGWWYLGGNQDNKTSPVGPMPIARPIAPAPSSGPPSTSDPHPLPVLSPVPAPSDPAPAPVVKPPSVPSPSVPTVPSPYSSSPSSPPLASPSPAIVPPKSAPGEPRLSIATRIVALPCSTVTVQADRFAGDVSTFRGIVGSGAPRAALDAIVAPLPAARVAVRTFPNNDLSCRFAEMVRAQGGGARLTASGGPTLSTGDDIRVRLTMPDFAGVVRLDDLDTRGKVSHLMEANMGEPPRFPAGATVGLGLSGDDLIGHVGPPYGTDLLVAIISSEPLVTSHRPAEEEAAPFLDQLSTAIAALRRRGGSVAADAVLVTTARR